MDVFCRVARYPGGAVRYACDHRGGMDEYGETVPVVDLAQMGQLQTQRAVTHWLHKFA